MKRVRHLLIFVAAGLLCTGCWPLRITSSPGASGVLVDAQTHLPIGGARAVVCNPLPRWAYTEASIEMALTNARPPVVISDHDGKFFIPPAHQWIIYYPSPMEAPSMGYLVVRQDHYQPALVRLCADGTEKVGVISLKPIAK